MSYHQLIIFYSEKKAASSYILSARVDTRFGTQGKPIELVISLYFFLFLNNTSSILVMVVLFKALVSEVKLLH